MTINNQTQKFCLSVIIKLRHNKPYLTHWGGTLTSRIYLIVHIPNNGISLIYILKPHAFKLEITVKNFYVSISLK